MKWILILVVLGVILAGAGVAFMYSGIYNVSAASGHTALMRWILETTRDNSVEHHAEGIAVPSDLEGPVPLEGVRHYVEMCEVCHGAPGVKAAEFAEGLLPEPPDLKKSVVDLSSAEIFWIVKNGIKMTGMPAFGPTHTDGQIWGIVRLVQALPGMTEAEYARLKKEAMPPE